MKMLADSMIVYSDTYFDKTGKLLGKTSPFVNSAINNIDNNIIIIMGYLLVSLYRILSIEFMYLPWMLTQQCTTSVK